MSPSGEDKDTKPPTGGDPNAVSFREVRAFQEHRLTQARETARKNLELSTSIVQHLERILERGNRQQLDEANKIMVDRSLDLAEIGSKLQKLAASLIDSPAEEPAAPTKTAETVHTFEHKRGELVRQASEYSQRFFASYGRSNFKDDEHFIGWFSQKCAENGIKGILTASQARDFGIQKREGEPFVKIGSGNTFINSKPVEVAIYAHVSEISGDPVLMVEAV